MDTITNHPRVGVPYLCTQSYRRSCSEIRDAVPERVLKNSAVLLVQCPDRKGIDATLADFIYRHEGNILHFEQHQAGEERFYLARIEWDLVGFQLDLTDFAGRFNPVAEKFGM